MRDDDNALEAIRRARYEAEISNLMLKRNPRHHALMNHFAEQSEAFVKLRANILDHYYFEQRQRSPLFAVDAMVQLVDRMLDTMRTGMQKAA